MRSPLEYFALALSLDGVDEEAGDAQTTGWYGLFRAPVVPSVAELGEALQAMWNDLDAGTQRDLQHQKGGMIMQQDSDGFVTVDLYDSDADLRAEWDWVVENIADEEEEE
jgi:hypothetical protein